MELQWSTLRVKDLNASIAFYEEILGLHVTRRFPAGPGSEIAFLGGAGPVEIELIADGSGRDINVGTDISWGFSVDSLDTMMALLNEKGIAFEGPVSPNPSIRFIFFPDLDGMRIQLAESSE
ncbi:MAG: VOC family protein [Coriobacteriales bacterium]|jgi:lactoylglutathione lyase|nr:VOC family protein [Coriobacteriales bacterium]